MREIYTEYIKNSLVPVARAKKEELILAEIGYDQINTATSFVEYLYDKYGFSKSCIWYNLKKLERSGALDFAEKGEMGKPLCLTASGVGTLRKILSHRQKIPAMARVTVRSELGTFNGY